MNYLSYAKRPLGFPGTFVHGIYVGDDGDRPATQDISGKMKPASVVSAPAAPKAQVYNPYLSTTPKITLPSQGSGGAIPRSVVAAHAAPVPVTQVSQTSKQTSPSATPLTPQQSMDLAMRGIDPSSTNPAVQAAKAAYIAANSPNTSNISDTSYPNVTYPNRPDMSYDQTYQAAQGFPATNTIGPNNTPGPSLPGALTTVPATVAASAPPTTPTTPGSPLSQNSMMTTYLTIGALALGAVWMNMPAAKAK